MTPKAQEAKKISPEAPIIKKQPKECTKDPLYTETYWKVRFHERRNKEESFDVTLTLIPDQLVIPRGKETIIPGRFREVADHTIYQTYDQVPDKDRQVSGDIKRYPYDTLGETTEEEYLKLKEAGDITAREAAKPKQG